MLNTFLKELFVIQCLRRNIAFNRNGIKLIGRKSN